MTEEQNEKSKSFTGSTDKIKSEKKKEKKTTKRPTLRKQLQDVKEELEAAKDKYLRVLAEFDNYKKRRDRDFKNLREGANIALIEELLPIVDDFERSLNSSHKKKPTKAFYKGIELVYEKLLSIVKKQGVESIEAVGKTFDPELHEAVMQVEVEEKPTNTVVEEVLTGYKLKDKVIRYSKVVVTK